MHTIAAHHLVTSPAPPVDEVPLPRSAPAAVAAEPAGVAGEADRAGEAGRAGRLSGTSRRATLVAGLRERFRLPARDDPAPHPARLAGVCGWAAGLGLVGLPVAARSSVAIMTGTAPAWFEPVVVTVGVLGIVLTAAAFTAIHRRWLPWLLLAAATVPLAVNLALALRA